MKIYAQANYGISIDKAEECNIYDNIFLWYGAERGYYNFNEDQSDAWTDSKEAEELTNEILDDCDEYSKKQKDEGKFYECFSNNDKGNNWSMVFCFCSMTMMLTAINSVITFFGAHSFYLRSISSCCGFILCWVTTACIITVAVFRFNTLGSLAALSKMGTMFTGGDDMFLWEYSSSTGQTTFYIPTNADRTYEGDAYMIVWCWSLMLIFCCFNYCTMGNTLRTCSMASNGYNEISA